MESTENDEQATHLFPGAITDTAKYVFVVVNW